MRRVTFKLDIALSGLATFRLIDPRMVREDELLGKEHFDVLLAELVRLGCSYEVEEVFEPKRLMGNTVFPRYG